MFPPELTSHTPPQAMPAGVNHYNTFACILSLLYMSVVLLGCFMLFQMGLIATEAAEDLILLVIANASLCAICASSLFFPRTRWAWIAHLVIASMATGSCCFAPFTLYIIARYLEPEVRDYFGVSSAKTAA